MLSIALQSGFYTASSTVSLPLDVRKSSGQVTGMPDKSLNELLERVEIRLKTLGLSAQAASEKAGLTKDAIRNLKRAAAGKSDRKGVSTRTAKQLARALETTPGWLLSGDGAETFEDLSSEDVAAGLSERPRPRTVKLKGYVGAGSEAHFYALSDEDFEEVEAPLSANDQTIAVEIKGTSFGPLMDSWIVYYDDVRSPITEDLLGKICVVGLSDDRILIKKIVRDGRGGYNLLSNSAEDPILGVEIEWAAKVTDMKPRS
ncbi:phage repressor protein [Tardiphaga sp. vice352]|uniref:XRE family transcriptional regulator n=1 Tax=Tardiphaga sp. vice352 TaxID=2592816 RepID=UPI001161DDAA|nr:phage repressor protein [Tardiphaga sp. vice352]QDM32070.1 phage repressor protein [Tardiphaga sp. vice352]